MDSLCHNGINSRGFGIIPKLVMTDTTLSAESKAIYAYIVSFAGAGETAYPGQKKIMSDLGISVNTYYKHYDPLISHGYLRVSQEIKGMGRGKCFGNNVYTIVTDLGDTGDSHEIVTYGSVRNSGIRSRGYGTVPKLLMEDRDVSIKSKALYAFFCSLAGAGNCAVPSKDSILYYLSVSDKTYRNAVKELTDKGYVSVKRERKNGTLGGNIFILNEDIKPGGKICDTQNVPCGMYAEAQTCETNNNRIKNNTETVIHIEEDNKENIYDRRKAYKEICSLTYFGKYVSSNDPEDREVYDSERLFTEALADMISSRNGTRICGNIIDALEVREKLMTYTEKDSEGNDILVDICENAIADYEKGSSRKTLVNPLGYMKSCIWDAMKKGSSYDYACIRRDF